MRQALFDWHRTHGQNVSRTCRHFGISRPTFYRWQRRYVPGRPQTLEDRACVPRARRQPSWTAEQARAVRDLREQYPRWGKAKLQCCLARAETPRGALGVDGGTDPGPSARDRTAPGATPPCGDRPTLLDAPVWHPQTGRLRGAGTSLANIPGDPKAVACIEDTAVAVEDQPEFVLEFQEILKKYDMDCVFYAHIGDGEIHLRPVLDLKVEKDRQMFFTITDEVASLVKKFRGSLSGEHGDGRVRGEFIKKMVGEKNYKLIEEVKTVWILQAFSTLVRLFIPQR